MARPVNHRRRATDRRAARRVDDLTGRVADRRARLVWTEDEVLRYLQNHADAVHLPDEQLAHWADLYQEERVAALEIPFGVFIACPRALCRQFGITPRRVADAPPEGFDMLPLLDAQREVMIDQLIRDKLRGSLVRPNQKEV